MNGHPRPRQIGFKAMDDAVLWFDLPRGASRPLVLAAIASAHEGEEDTPSHLTPSEAEFVADVVAKLKEHRPRREGPAEPEGTA